MPARSRFAYGAVALVAASTLFLTACSSGSATSSPSSTASAGATATIRVSTLGFCDDPIVWGIDQGIFADHGLDVELTTVQSGAAGVSALQAGEIDVAYANPLTSLQAIDGGVDLKIVSGSSLSNKKSNELIVASDSSVTDAADLDGTTVALNALGGLAEIVTAAWIKDKGDGATASFVAVPFADQVTSVVNGTVQSAEVGASQAASAHDDGTVRSLGNPFYDIVGEIPTSFYVANSSWISDNKKAAASFAEAMTDVAASANDAANDDARFDVTAASCGSTAEALKASAEPSYVGQLEADSVSSLVKLLVDADAIGKTDVDDVLPKLARAE